MHTLVSMTLVQIRDVNEDTVAITNAIRVSLANSARRPSPTVLVVFTCNSFL